MYDVSQRVKGIKMKNEGKIKEITSQIKATEGETKTFMSPEPPKRARGRPKKETTTSTGATSAGSSPSQSPQDQNAQTVAPPPIPTSVIVKPIVHVLDRIGVGYVGHPGAAMKPEELEGIATALGLVLDKWMPTMSQKYGPELALSVALGQYGLRIMAAKKYVESEKKKSEMKAKGEPPGPMEPSRMEEPSAPQSVPAQGMRDFRAPEFAEA